MIVRTDRIGDVLLTLPMARILKRYIPGARVSMFIRHYTAELVEEDPSVDEIVYYDGEGGLVPSSKLIGELKAGKFDVVFHTHPRFRLALITWLAGIPIRVGTGYRWYSFLFNRRVYEHRKEARFHELEYNLHLLKAVGLPEVSEGAAPLLRIRSSALEKVTRLLGSNGVSAADKVVILHPGSGGSARDWSPDHFARLGRLIAGLPDVKVVITGGKGEEELVSRLQAAIGAPSLAVCDQLSLGEYAALAKSAALFISNSTGTIHIAAAAGTPVIGLYPHLVPLSAARWGPYTENKIIFSPKGQPPDCNRCTGEKGSICPCMETITVDEVFAAAAALLRGEQTDDAGSLSEKDVMDSHSR